MLSQELNRQLRIVEIVAYIFFNATPHINLRRGGHSFTREIYFQCGRNYFNYSMSRAVQFGEI
ncbi:hypothetical protein WJ32_19055 (plasmid) [Burkholderia ubonensis]|uniref:Uncharacterized protein n=1 Tax=Burkholderia ubonensis TaxID=101571 RepID=A0A103RZY5_9BURK|nr:hypothetical protein WJ32_19055 [Burkholderia ubonensis]KVG77032.1 hypothetical protein WJ33_01670 [Burkholderia ubonensis]